MIGGKARTIAGASPPEVGAEKHPPPPHEPAREPPTEPVPPELPPFESPPGEPVEPEAP